jgi:O-antigen/teichoic acid export membrane protein
MRQRSLTENSFLAFAGDSCSKASALAVVLVAARAFSVSEFALLMTGLAAAGVVTSVLDFGAGTMLTRDGTAGPARRGELLIAVMRVRLPLVIAVLLLAPLTSVFIGHPLTSVAVVGLGITGAIALTVIGAYRSCQDIRPEALQKLAAAIMSFAGAVVVSVTRPRTDLLIAALTLATLATLAPLMLRLRTIVTVRNPVRTFEAAKSMAPIGLLALATVAYYRAGTLVLAALSNSHETAAFGVAASIAFGMLMVPNAITTALLPRLSARPSATVLESTRRVLAWTVTIAIAMSAVAAAVVPLGLPLVIGDAYSAAGLPFALLCSGIPVIAASGVIGTSLLSLNKLRPLGIQVTVSLAVNLGALGLLVPRLGAVGAALATVLCEIVGLVLLIGLSRDALPGLLAFDRGLRRSVEAHGATIS